MANPEPGTSDFLAGFMDDYFAECDEHLTTIRRLLAEAHPAVEQGLAPDVLEELFRAYHSIKGLSGMVELRDAELLAHHMEGYLRNLRSNSVAFTSKGLDTLINGTSLLERVIAARRAGQPGPAIADAIQSLERLPQAGNTTRPAAPVVQPREGPRRVVFTPSPDLAARGITVDRVRAWLEGIGRIARAIPRVGDGGAIRFEFDVDDVEDASVFEAWADDGLVVAPAGPPTTALIAAEEPAPAATAGPSVMAGSSVLTASHFVRVDLARLDELMRMIGDLVITRARLADAMTTIEGRVPPVEWRAVQENSHAMERQLRDLREGVMRVRLVRVGEIFGRMPFVVRDLARETGRQIDLSITGQETEIDKYLVERMMDPILHLVRNAVSHGIEPAHERVAAGKPEAGRITLSAASVGDLVTVEIADDGRGVDVEAVARRARAIGLPVDDGALAGAGLLDILCAPGFSTRDTADLAAGRGVGMAVVQGAVRELGGTLALDTAPGQGTRYVIQLPLTLAITDAIIASVGGQTFAVPQSSVREIIDVERDAIRRLENHEIVPYRSGVLPIVRLATVFGLEPRPGRTQHVFVVGTGLTAVGVAVDRVRTQREVVVRPMTDPLIKVEGITGATDLGDGRVVLILDLGRISRQASSGGASAGAGQAGRRSH